MPAAEDLTTLASVKSWLDITASSSDVELARLITAASDFITTYVGRQIKSGSLTQKVDGNGRSELLFREWPVTAVTSVKVGGVAVAASPDGLSSGYVFDERRLILLQGSTPSVFTAGKLNVELGYAAGYASVPSEIEQVCIDIVGRKYKERMRIGMVSEGLAGQATSFSQKDLGDDARGVLGKYRRVFAI